MKLIMENWRKFLIKESDKGMGPSTVQTFNAFAPNNSVFKEYAASHGLSILRIKNIFEYSFGGENVNKKVGLANAPLMVPPDSMTLDRGASAAMRTAADILEWAQGELPQEDEKRKKLETIAADVKRFYNCYYRSGDYPIFEKNGPEEYLFLMDSDRSFTLMVNEADESGTIEPGLRSASYISLPGADPGKEVVVRLRKNEPVPLPTELSSGGGQAALAGNKQALEDKIMVSNTSNEFGADNPV